MKLRVLDAADPAGRAEWLAVWRAWPEREPMAHPGFAALFGRPEDRVVALADGDATGGHLFPLIVRPLEGGLKDATTPYGYGGAFAWGQRDDAAFWRAYAGWASDERLVTTFARLSLFPDQLAAPPEAPVVLQQNIVVPLAGGRDALWKGYEGKVRKWVKTAEAAGLTVEVDETGARLADFISIYHHTMTRNGASSFYLFQRPFFDALLSELAGSFALFHASKAGRVVSSDLMLLSRRRAYYFLGGTLEEAFDDGPNYLLKHRALEWAADKGLEGFVLGGGVEAGDGLFRYKRAYARAGETPFQVLRLTHDAAAGAALEAARAAREPGWTPRPGYFPRYRG